MKQEELEQLLYEEESPTLDFKRDQYPFSKATDEEKSELLKDILGFANCFRRTEAFILIGVEEVRGGRSIVHGVSEHLDDHSLQQFINSLTNRPVVFRYDTCDFDGKQVGVIRVEQQRRPIFLKKDYGKLRKGEVYVRRGSSTNPNKPADPDEIAAMGVSLPSPAQDASLVVEFADRDTEETLGSQIDWSAEFCTMPPRDEIPDLKEPSNKVRIPGGGLIDVSHFSSFDSDRQLNDYYYHELANYEFFRRLAKRIRLVVMNTGDVPASDVRLEMTIPLGEGIWIPNSSETPGVPMRRKDRYDVISSSLQNLKPNHLFRQKGYVDIAKNDQRMKIEIECGNLQPGRKVWTDNFDMLIGRTGEFKLTGQLFAGNLREPQEFSLTIDATIDQTTMTIDELMSLKDPVDEER